MANTSSVAEAARACTEGVITALGFELVDVRYINEDGRWRLRFYIDKPGGVGLDDCEAVSREIEALIEVEEVVAGKYALEVSSPGLDRPLFRPADYIRFAGSLAKVKTRDSIGDNKVFTGRITGPDDAGFDIVSTDGKHKTRIEYDQVQKANLEVDF